MPKSAPSLKPKTAAGPRAKSGAKSGGKGGAKSRAGGKAGGGGAAPLRDAEGSKAAKRAGRHLKVGTEASTLATRLLVARLAGRGGAGDGEALSAALGSLKGPLMKIAPDPSPPFPMPCRPSMSPPCASCNPTLRRWGPWFVKRRMQAEPWGRTGGRASKSSRKPRRRRLRSAKCTGPRPAGGLLACKLQYPDMASAVEADLAPAAPRLLALSALGQGRSTPAMFMRSSRCACGEELDYEREARNLTLYRALLAGEEGVRLPEPVPEPLHRPPARDDLAGRPPAGGLSGGRPAAGRAQPARRAALPCLVPALLPGRGHPRRPRTLATTLSRPARTWMERVRAKGTRRS